MKRISFDFPSKSREVKAHCAHQAMMELVIREGYATKKWQPMWARIIKQSEISDIDLVRLICVARKLPDRYSPAGFVRNRLMGKDWINYFNDENSNSIGSSGVTR